jgi:hypothetical protein
MADNDVFAQTEGKESGDTNPLQELVGEGKKFTNVEELARGKLQADTFIEQLKEELKLTREQMGNLEQQAQKKATVSELVDAVKNANNPEQNESGNHPISEDQLQEMVNSILDGRNEAQTRVSNYQQANQSVLDKFEGDLEAAKAYTAERAKQLGMSTDQLKALGEESPSAFRQLMEVSHSTGSQGVSGLPERKVEGPNHGNRKEVVDGHHTKAYYDKLKAELGPVKYWNDTKIQGQYLQDAHALGDRFNQ